MHASDLWLAVQIICAAARLELTFEIKVHRVSQVQLLRFELFDYALRLLREQGLKEDFQPRDLRLSRTSPGELRHEESLLDDCSPLSDCFSFTNRHILGVLEKGAMCQTPATERTNDSTLRQPEDIICKALSVRKLQFRGMSPPANRKSSRKDAVANRKCQGCSLC